MSTWRRVDELRITSIGRQTDPAMLVLVQVLNDLGRAILELQQAVDALERKQAAA